MKPAEQLALFSSRDYALTRNAIKRVDNEPFRRQFLALKKQGVTATDIVRRLGWDDRHGSGHTRLMRVLGLVEFYDYYQSAECRERKVQEYVNPATALKLCEALKLDPRDAGF